MLSRYLPSGFRQIPVRSGLPSAAVGTGAVMLGLPSGVRGTLGSGTFTQCASRIAIAASIEFIKQNVRPQRGRTFHGESCLLISSKLEVGFCRTVGPCTGDRAIIRTNVLELAVRDKMGRISLFVFSVRFKVDQPF